MPEHKPIDYTPQSASLFRSREEIERELHQSDEETNENPNVTSERRQVRHSFDIYADQLQALHGIQGKRWNQTGKKPKISTLVQEAFDAYIASQEAHTD